MEHDHLDNQIREVWLHRLVLVVLIQHETLHLILHILLLRRAVELYLGFKSKPDAALLVYECLGQRVAVEGLSLQHGQEVIEIFL